MSVENALIRAKEFAADFIKKHPETESDVKDYLQLMEDEIAEGESPDNEYDVFVSSCEDLIEEND